MASGIISKGCPGVELQNDVQKVSFMANTQNSSNRPFIRWTIDGNQYQLVVGASSLVYQTKVDNTWTDVLRWNANT